MTGRPIITAALCWHDEPAESLVRCVRSLEGFADRLVSMEGPYAHFTERDGYSSLNQSRALRKACALIDMPHTEIPRPAVAPTQAAKRTELYRSAALRSDWVLVIDADEVLSGDYRGVRDVLHGFGDGFDCATVTSTTGGSPSLQVRLLRAMDALTCGPEYHGMLSATDPDGRRVRIRDRREILEREHPRPRRAREIDLGKLLTITNHTNDRPDDRKAAKREYVRRRTDAGIDL